jgi:small acid-soluble spore protein B (major beta-type SASP)
MTNNTNKLLVPGSEQVLEQMKQEIAQEFGVKMGADATARQNGSVGGEMTKRMIALAQEQLKNARQ